jgi:putative transposase
MFAAEVRRRRVDRMRACKRWRWHLDEVHALAGG